MTFAPSTAYRPTPPQPSDAVYIEKPGLDPFGEPLAGGPPAQEVHRFLVHLPSELPGGRLLEAVAGWRPCTQGYGSTTSALRQQLCQVLLLRMAVLPALLHHF